jgi:endoglucanase
MKPAERILFEFARRLMHQPAAPYHEHAVRGEVERICVEAKLPYERDAFGNVLVSLRNVRRHRPLVLAAHLDHPGFEIMGRSHNGRLIARFQGGVANEYLRSRVPVRLMPGNVPAVLGRRKRDVNQRLFELHPQKPVSTTPEFAVWELVDFALRNGQIHGRACDDLIGAATILTTLVELKRRRAEVDVIGVLSRAEEIGFQGALALAAAQGLPNNSLVISLETSKELPGVKMGRGVIIRVGDRTSIFSSEATRFLTEVAIDKGTRKRPFPFQRALMSGGTCEATAYQEFGFESAAVCVALGNYHNCAERSRIAAEFVSLADAHGMAELLIAAALQMPRYQTIIGRLPARLDKLRRQAQPELKKTASGQS